MNRKDVIYFTGMLIVTALLIANLFKPTAPQAYELPGDSAAVPVDIAATGDSAWAIIGERVYFLSLRTKSQLPSGQRTINVIDSKNLN